MKYFLLAVEILLIYYIFVVKGVTNTYLASHEILRKEHTKCTPMHKRILYTKFARNKTVRFRMIARRRDSFFYNWNFETVMFIPTSTS